MEDAKTHYNQGLEYSNQGSDDKAIELYNKAIELDPNYVDAYCNRGFSYANLKEYEKAIADYNKAIELDPNYATAYYNLVCVFSLKKNKKKSLYYLEKSLQLGYDDFAHIEKEADFDYIRNTIECKALIKKYKDKHKK